MLFLLKINYEWLEIMNADQFYWTYDEISNREYAYSTFFKTFFNETSNEEVQSNQPSELNKFSM